MNHRHDPQAADSIGKPETTECAKSTQVSGPDQLAEGVIMTPLPRLEPGFPVVGIGASAGGLEALQEFFAAVPEDSGLSYVVVVHLDPKHISILPELLQKCTKMPVTQISDGMPVLQDHVYVVPPNRSLSIMRGVLLLSELEEGRGRHLPIDSFFRSLAQDQSDNGICVILSGTGTDGTMGARAIKGASGMVMVQDDASAKYDGMPRSAVAAGVADCVLPPKTMPARLVQYVRHLYRAVDHQGLPGDDQHGTSLQKIFALIRARTSHDFSLYKKNTILRRIARRMNVHQIEDVSDYLGYLHDSEGEVGVLFRDLLIGVTSFFRDPEVFLYLQQKAFPKLLNDKPEDCVIRVWSAGCSTGEEAYSLAIALHEYMETSGRRFHVQIFATDIDESAIATARAGVYPASIETDIGDASRLNRYFEKDDTGRYRVKKQIREMLVFAPQNILKDPPFTKLDILSCRNVLIYLGSELQKRLLPVFHYSLKRDGLLLLGSSETVGASADMFDVIHRKWKVYRRAADPSSAGSSLVFPSQIKLADEEELTNLPSSSPDLILTV
jgi:two-component system CheB/CheR fusion protein